jgi:hypothetical protein
MSTALDITLDAGDITESHADVVLLKHARGFFGADLAVARRLEKVGIPESQLEVALGAHLFVETHGAIGAPLALFLGTVKLGQFGYHEIRQFAARALQALESRPGIRHVACTVHGPNYGLDEDEAALALVGGLVEAFLRGAGPPSLERITVVELQPRRAERLRRALERGLGKTPGVEPLATGWGFRVKRPGHGQAQVVQAPPLATAGAQSLAKPHAFVAMPFAPELEDVYHYGIQGPVKAADLSMANPNVYLEVGYAWGRGRQTILLVRDIRELKFDVAGYRCLIYKNIRDLETQLSRELQHLG